MRWRMANRSLFHVSGWNCLPLGTDPYSDQVYEAAAENLKTSRAQER